ncbi:TraU family protein [Burkholderia ubonensis]|uniref:TraU family protein n=1 Tax=Burkholderia ubonensis TaxID=101571 RepID=UPI0009B432A7|nr:TraU family protein [Burkholderia ubonensis]
MRILKKFRTILGAAAVALAATVATPAMAGTPGCVGKMWNPIADLDFRLMGGISIAGFSMLKPPSQLGEPPKHKAQAVCFCKNGLKTGFGLGLTFWMPSYIDDMARQSGCMGFLSGINILPGFISQSSGQEYNQHAERKDGVTNMQVHWAYADVTAIAGKSLFEKCDAVTGAMSIAYMTEPDFIFQNDVYSVIMTPQASILAAVPLLSQMTCGFESIANTLGGWQDWGVCAWKGTRMPYSGTAIAKDSAQVSNMDITVKYLSRSSLLGTTMRTMGKDATCKPVYSPFYDPFQHRYQWAYPGKVATRYNVDVIKWGLFIKDAGQGSMLSLANQTASLGNVSAVDPGASNGSVLGRAEAIVKGLPKPLNYPSREAGYMQVWEARQCCLMVLTITNVLKMIAENLATMGGGILAQLYEFYNMANTVYQIIQDPIGAALNFVGDLMMDGISQLADMSGLTDALGSVADGVKESLGALAG